MKLKSLLIIAICLSFFACNQVAVKNNSSADTLKKVTRNNQEKDVSLITLIANPDQNAGRKVRVVGYLILEFEGNALYLNKSDYDQSITKNALWIEIPRDSLSATMRKCSKNYVLIEGIFNTSEGHMSLFSGSIKDITRMEIRRP